MFVCMCAAAVIVRVVVVGSLNCMEYVKFSRVSIGMPRRYKYTVFIFIFILKLHHLCEVR